MCPMGLASQGCQRNTRCGTDTWPLHLISLCFCWQAFWLAMDNFFLYLAKRPAYVLPWACIYLLHFLHKHVFELDRGWRFLQGLLCCFRGRVCGLGDTPYTQGSLFRIAPTKYSCDPLQWVPEDLGPPGLMTRWTWVTLPLSVTLLPRRVSGSQGPPISEHVIFLCTFFVQGSFMKHALHSIKK